MKSFIMRWTRFILLQAVIALVATLIIGVLIYKHQDKVTLIKTPPAELAQWYKPENKRQVWLHNMFKLRRELQAVEYYAEKSDAEHLNKWSNRLQEHYLKIADMVPQWQEKLAITTINSLKESSESQNFQAVLSDVKKLQQNCTACHNDYQAITALTYRAPDFSNIKLDISAKGKHQEVSYVDHMKTLTQQVNQIKIASEDGLTDLALSSLHGLNQNMIKLGETCVNCHKKQRDLYPSAAMNKTLQNLEVSISTGTLKQQGRDLGTLAVQACATCHGTHRLAFGAKQKLSQTPSFSELIKH
jgi:cytochrome c556